MIKSGKDHLEQLRDGRVVFIGDEKVSDVTKHPSLKSCLLYTSPSPRD